MYILKSIELYLFRNIIFLSGISSVSIQLCTELNQVKTNTPYQIDSQPTESIDKIIKPMRH